MGAMRAAVIVLGFIQAECQLDPKDISRDVDFRKFKEFIDKHRGGMGYSSEIETIGRFTAFKQNLRLAEERNTRAALNAKPGQKRETHGITQFMDLTPQEFSAKYKGLRPSRHLKKNFTDVKPNNFKAQS